MAESKIRQKISQQKANSMTHAEMVMFSFLGVAFCHWRWLWVMVGAVIVGCSINATLKKYRCPECRKKLPFFVYDHSHEQVVHCPSCGTEFQLTEQIAKSNAPGKGGKPWKLGLGVLVILGIWFYCLREIWTELQRSSVLIPLSHSVRMETLLAGIAFSRLPFILHRYWGKACPHCGGHVPNKWLFKLHLGQKQTHCTHCGREL